MLKNPKLWVLTTLLLLILTMAGCKINFDQLFQADKQEDQLIKVEIHFANNDNLTAYVKSLGVEKDGEVYVGGSSVNFLYDRKGTIIGSFNYAKVEYIKIIE